MASNSMLPTHIGCADMAAVCYTKMYYMHIYMQYIMYLQTIYRV